jgi:preprotein translocase subunit SecA
MNRACTLPSPGLVWGRYPEERVNKQDVWPWWLASMHALLLQPGKGPAERCLRRLRPGLAEAKANARDAFPAQVETLRRKLARRQLSEQLIIDSFALIDAACERELGIRAHDGQFAAARLMLENRMVEMGTGEGKTLAAVLAAATAALGRVPVHIITSNDYLALRDSDELRPVYAALGLRVGTVTGGLGTEQRREAYASDVTYCTAKEVVFDYLRDSLARRKHGSDLEQRATRLVAGAQQAPATVLRGLCMAIVDEADSILIDEARVPLILSQGRDDAVERSFYEHALGIASEMREPRDYVIERPLGSVAITSEGRKKLSSLPASRRAIQRDRRHLEESVCLALTALHVLERDRHYLVRDGAVIIIEPTTGRAAPGRAWSRGLHQLVELKERCAASPRSQTVAQITYQRFFPRYVRLCGMSATIAESRAELLSVYGCRMTRVRLSKPSRRVVLPPRLFTSCESRWCSVVERVVQMHVDGRPVLIGTASVSESEELSRRFAAADLAHAVLNARHDASEAKIVAAAGELGRITIATNMAGRGTDIALGAGVAERGGLHVIRCQHNISRRIDRQFLGRCARRGEPGSCETMLALDDLPEHALEVRLLKSFYRGRTCTVPRWMAYLVVRLAAWREDFRQRAQRRKLGEDDARAERSLPLHRPSLPKESA